MPQRLVFTFNYGYSDVTLNPANASTVFKDKVGFTVLMNNKI